MAADPVPSGWQYANMPEARHAFLEEQVSLADQISAVIAVARLEERVAQDPCDECRRNRLPPAHRVTFAISTAGPDGFAAFDRLLNGAYGLRALYAASAAVGERANAQVCRALCEAVGGTRMEGSAELSAADRECVVRSLSGPSAKVWYDVQTDRAGADLELGSLTCDRWRESAADVERTMSELDGTLGLQDVESRLLKGCTAPQPLGLHVKGAFVRADKTEYVTRGKVLRSRQIHLLGWT